MARRDFRMRGVCVRTVMPSRASSVQLVCRRGAPSTSTTQRRHEADGDGAQSREHR